MSVRSSKNEAEKLQVTGKRTTKPWRSLLWQLIFLTILPLTVLVLVISFGSFAIHQNAMRMLVGERDERAVRTAAAALDDQVSHRMTIIRSLALLADPVDSSGLEQILLSSAGLLDSSGAYPAFFTSTGSLAFSAGNYDLWAGLESQIAPIIRSLQLDNGSPTYLSSSFSHPVDGEPLVLMLAASPGGKWVAVGAFSAAELVRPTLINAFAHGSYASVIVVDTAKRILYQAGSISLSGEGSEHPGIAEALSGESGTTYLPVDNSEHVIAYSPITSVNWALVLEEPWEMVATPTLRASQMAPLILVPVLILALAALWLSARQVVKPLQTLESRAARLAQGDFKAIEEPVGGIEEIRHLQSELVHMAHEVQAAQQSLHGYIGAITAAQEDERRRLARELHDDTIQALIALKQRVQLAQLARHTSPESNSLNEIALLTEQTIENLRRLTRALRPIYLEDLGLVTALEMLARETSLSMKFPVDFQRKGQEIRLDPAIELALYRMAQEAFSNLTRHAQASHAGLNIGFTHQLVTLQVTDNGIGFIVPKSPAEFAPNGHYGLLGLHERAELIGASLEIQSSPGHGTQLRVDLPIRSSLDGKEQSQADSRTQFENSEVE